jgi:hypothetical protein
MIVKNPGFSKKNKDSTKARPQSLYVNGNDCFSYAHSLI